MIRKTIVRIDKSPMNPTVKVAQLECGHDVYVNRTPRIGSLVDCERCDYKAKQAEIEKK